MSIAATTNSDHRVRNALIAGSATGAVVAMAPVMANTMFASPVYGERFGTTVLRNSLPMMGVFALPAGLGAGTSQLVGGGGLGIAAGAAVGGIAAGALGATVLHGALNQGVQHIGRGGTGSLAAAGGLLAGGLAAALASSFAANPGE